MNKERKVVLVDMDGVLADFDSATESFLREYYPDIPIAARGSFYFRDDYTEAAHQAVINELHHSQGFFRDLPVLSGAIDGWRQIEDLGYQPRICTSPLNSNEWCAEEKRHWLTRHLGHQVMSAAIIDSRKEDYDAIALIDDRPIIKNADQASWQHIVFSAPYNQNVDTEFRLKDWSDPNLQHLLAHCAKLATSVN